jgi:hypothetical protein
MLHDASAALSGGGRIGVWLPEWLPANDAGALDKLYFLQSFVRHVRWDIYSTWRQTTKQDGAKGSAYDQHLDEPVSDALLSRHVAGEIALGLYLMQPGSDTTLFAAYDIDDHAGTVPWDQMAAVALRLASAAKQRGLYASGVRSGGGRGIHLLLRWDKPQPARDVRKLMSAILEDAGLADGADGITIEIFPKQPKVAPGAFGNLLALPFGRRSVPLDRNMEAIDKPLLWPSSTPVPTSGDEGEDDVELKATAEQLPADMTLVKEALSYIDAAPHDVWIDVALALKHDSGWPGFLVWVEWSKTCPDKFKQVKDPDKLWDNLNPRDEKPITVGTIYYLAMRAGWPGPHPYEERHGAFYLINRTNGERKRLINFAVRIAEDITIDEGSDYLQRKYVLESKRGRATIDADKFSTLGWVDDIMGAKAVIAPESRLKGHVVAAIKQLSSPVERTVYAHYGWRGIGDRWLYLHSDGAIGADGPVDGIEVQAGANLSAYSLPAVRGDGPPAILASLSLVELCPAVMWPLLAGVYRAPLGEYCPVTTSLLLTGATGVGKTTVAMLAQSHYGIFDRVPANWTSTGNALERMAFVTKDAVLLIDDFVPKAVQGDVRQLLAKAEQVFRGAANRSGRGRLNQRLTFQPEYYPRGLILATGEDVPMGESLRARIVIVPVAAGSIPIGKPELDKAQAQARAGVYAQAMAGYIQWLARQDRLGARLTARQDVLRGEASGSHARTAENIGSLMLGIETMLQFAVAMAAITPQQSEGYRQSAWDALHGQVKVQTIYLQDEAPAKRFTVLIRAVIGSGRGHIAAIHGGAPDYAAVLGWQSRQVKTSDGSFYPQWDPQGRLVGWLEVSSSKGTVVAMHLYLDPETAYAEAQLLASAEGQPLPVGAKTLWKRLGEAGLLVTTEPDHQTIRKRILGATLRVLHLNVRRTLGLGEDQAELHFDKPQPRNEEDLSDVAPPF